MKALALYSIILFFIIALLTLLLLSWPIKARAKDTVDRQVLCPADQTFIKRRLDSKQQDNLCDSYRGKVLLVVNTASRCAFTGQYDDLEKLYQRYKDRGLVVIGFPSNDFGAQEPGSEDSIKSFCRLTYGVQFPMYAKTVVKGENADPFYQRLTEATNQAPRWNFHKYLIDRNGNVVDQYSSVTGPLSGSLTGAIEKLL